MNKKIYGVVIKEIFKRKIYLETDSEKEAIKQIRNMYKQGKIKMDGMDFDGIKIYVEEKL